MAAGVGLVVLDAPDEVDRLAAVVARESGDVVARDVTLPADVVPGDLGHLIT